MSFGAAGFLPLVALAAIPAIIHLLSRVRLKRAAFPSLLLLSTVRKERFSWLRLKEWLLLVLRTLALLLLLGALARPYVRVRLPGLGRGRDLVIVLDDSYSMGHSDRWQKAVAVVRSLVSSVGTGQRVALVRTEEGGNQKREGEGQRSKPDWAGQGGEVEWERPGLLLARVDSLRPSYGAAGLEPSLMRAVALAEETRGEVVVVTDLQERAMPDSWVPPKGTTIVLVDVGGGHDNAGVTRVWTSERFPLAGRPVRVSAEFANWGAGPVTRTAVLELGTRHEEKVVSLPAKGRARVEFETAYADSGPVGARVELRSDSLGADDSRWLAVVPLRQVKVLVVESPAVPARYLVDALGQDTLALFRLSVIQQAEFGRHDPRDYGLVVVTDAAALGRSDWTRLSFHVQSGGAALVLAGTAPEDSGAGFGLVRFAGTARSGGFAVVTEVDTAHAALAMLTHGDLEAARFFTRARIEPVGGRVLARLSDGSPLLVESHEGRLVVGAFGPVPEQTDLVYKAAFVPLVHRLLASLANARLGHEYSVGDTVRMTLDRSQPVEVQTPERRVMVQPTPGRGRPEVVFAAAGVPGIYAVADVPVAVNVDAAEGDLSRADVRLLSGQGYEIRTEAGSRTSDLSQVALYLAALAFALVMILLI